MATTQRPGSGKQPHADFRFACVGCGMTLPIRICRDGKEGALVACAFCGEHYRAMIDPEADGDALASVVVRSGGAGSGAGG